ncbi:hypothetical protein EJ05DRAFT_504664 [Pseudovirgaria hyperparasitica]|uniref:MFS general substrate transporter n=1 Tax=Pseudovirgaria hyperparasitica TaxID=470096 RepID=A0A6A6VSC6_9PEZI|nr:uncharacterized protein EJ05DRAFT_504664 [Pseudovirgaria hyperparasitica]KAF2753568.1 hypothetical protein EJ05DRAFT_504664 [Pseudovirgaria hyperparasitica]
MLSVNEPLESPRIGHQRASSLLVAMDTVWLKRRDGHTIWLISSIMAFSSIARALQNTSRVYLYEQSRCRIQYLDHDPALLSTTGSLSVPEALCKTEEIQSTVASFVGADFFVSALPGIFVLAAYQKLLPVVGFRPLLFLNALATAISLSLYTISFYFQKRWDAYGALAATFIDGIGGGDAVLSTLLYSVIAETCDESNLSISNYYQTAIWNVSKMAGTVIGSALLRSHVWVLNSCSILGFLITAAHYFLLTSQIGVGEEDGTSTEPLLPRPKASAAMQPISEIAFMIIRSSVRETFTVLFSLFRMTHIPKMCLIFFILHANAWKIRELFPQFTSTTLSWDLSTTNQWLALLDLIGWVVLMCLPPLRRYVLSHFYSHTAQDILIIRACVLDELLACFAMGFSIAPVYLIGMCSFAMAHGSMDSLRSFGAQHLGIGETVPQFYTRVAFILSLARLIGPAAWSFAYSLILKSSFLPPGAIFWGAAGLWTFIAVITMTLKAKS